LAVASDSRNRRESRTLVKIRSGRHMEVVEHANGLVLGPPPDRCSRDVGDLVAGQRRCEAQVEAPELQDADQLR
jgi:hypothetical protein